MMHRRAIIKVGEEKKMWARQNEKKIESGHIYLRIYAALSSASTLLSESE
jgi:hypothetical protein